MDDVEGTAIHLQRFRVIKGTSWLYLKSTVSFVNLGDFRTSDIEKTGHWFWWWPLGISEDVVGILLVEPFLMPFPVLSELPLQVSHFTCENLAQKGRFMERRHLGGHKSRVPKSNTTTSSPPCLKGRAKTRRPKDAFPEFETMERGSRA